MEADMGENNAERVRVERRCALRVPVRGFAVLHADQGPLHGALENLSQTGALVNVAAKPLASAIELELRLSEGDGIISARTVRVAPAQTRGGYHVAVVFEHVDPATRLAIDTAIEHALSAAKRRPVLVIDDHVDRRMLLIQRLARAG
ncbi:MAG TPA: PilZ domain-containing protein, partial [Kofleriaceae bacterium]|nr:PilZ domain-containing protein [Kofleriaceae bacterium]